MRPIKPALAIGVERFPDCFRRKDTEERQPVQFARLVPRILIARNLGSLGGSPSCLLKRLIVDSVTISPELELLEVSPPTRLYSLHFVLSIAKKLQKVIFRDSLACADFVARNLATSDKPICEAQADLQSLRNLFDR